jgi:hypothetical protein
VVLFGGVTGSGVVATIVSDTWEWDGTTWLQRVTGAQLTGSGTHAMAFDPVAGRTVLMQRASQTDQRLAVWTWDGSVWQSVATPTVATSMPMMWAAAGRPGRTLLYDGSHLLQLTPTAASIGRYGAGCGAPPPWLSANSWPRPGAGAFALESSGHGPNALVALVGADATANIGFGACNLLVQPGGPTWFTIAGGSGFATFPLPIPAAPALLGAVFFFQAGSLLPNLQTSAGLRVSVGD